MGLGKACPQRMTPRRNLEAKSAIKESLVWQLQIKKWYN
jgi:hypothetical protein